MTVVDRKKIERPTLPFKHLSNIKTKELMHAKNTIESVWDVVKKSMSITENVVLFVKHQPL